MAGSSVTVAERQTTIQVQQSSYGQCLPVQFGTNRGAGNLVWFANFKANPKTTTMGGKGGSSTNTTYTYTASAILAICEGGIAGIGDVWKDTEKTTLADLGLTVFYGEPDQAVWSFLSGYSDPATWDADVAYGYANYGAAPAFVDQAINYSSTAYVAAETYSLGDAAQVPNHNFEVQGFWIIGSGNVDAHPANIIPEILGNTQYGVGFNTGWLGDLVSGSSSYYHYCQALGLFVSPGYNQQRPGTDVIKELAESTNSAVVWSGGKLKVLPYGDTSVTGNGSTFVPDVTPLFDLSDDDFITAAGDPPVKVTRKSPADAYNRVAVEFRDRANQYNKAVVYAEDLDAIEKYGLKIATTITLDMVCVGSIAKQIAQLALQRYLYKRNSYEFELPASFAMLEPMDVVTVTDLPQGIDRVPVRLLEIAEQEHSFTCTAEDMQIGVAEAATYDYDDGVRWTNATNIAPQDCEAPVIFELPADPSATGLSVAIAAGGQPADLAYGGCRVWLSLDGTTYKQEGVIWGSSRYGTLSATLASHAAGTDTTNTAHLSLRSNGQMLSGSADDLAQATTLIVCDGEYFAYQDATLTGTRAYDLTTLNRGLYGTTGSSHASGAAWVRVDDAIARLDDLDLTMIGQTVYIKLTAFNVYGQAEQSLADVSAYSYTITGDMKALETPVDFANVGGTTKPEDNADVSKYVTGAATITVNADYTGAITDALPLSRVYQLIRNGIDETASATWSASVISGTMAVSATAGTLSIDTSGGALTSGRVRLVATYGGVDVPLDIVVTVVQGSVPSGNIGNVNGSTSSTTMVAVGDELTITVGSSGNVALFASYEFTTASSGTYGEKAQWYKWNGSAYVAQGSPANHTASFVWTVGDPGYGYCNFTDTGLSVGSSQKYRLYMANSSGSVTRTITGDCSAASA